MTTLPRLLLGVCTLLGFTSLASAQMVPPPTVHTEGSGGVCNARTLGVVSPNPDILTELSGAVIEEGGTWEVSVDVSSFGPGAVVLLLSSRGSRINLGGTRRLLVDTSALIRRRDLRVHDGITPVTYSYPIPNDPSLCGLDAWVQAVVTGGPSFELSNGLHVYVGQ